MLLSQSGVRFCVDKQVIKELKDEPAIVRKRCFDHAGRTEVYYFALVNDHSEFYSEMGIFPIEEIPEQFKKTGLSVYISGHVTNCVEGAGCSEPDIRIADIHLCEIKSIRIND